MAGRTFARDGLGRFRRGGRIMTGKKVKAIQGLGRERGAGKDTGKRSSGGKIAGMDPEQASKQLTGPGEEVTKGKKVKR